MRRPTGSLFRAAICSGSFARTLDDIRKLGGNSPQDDLKFAAVERVSIINRRLYETCLAPFVRSITPPGFGNWARQTHPNRMRFAIFSDRESGDEDDLPKTPSRSASVGNQHRTTTSSQPPKRLWPRP